jgi:NAD(P)-dependent dehydrogenase (short-subunit alcohol dehydrogenase family)
VRKSELSLNDRGTNLDSRAGLQFTRTVHQDVYPSIDPTKPELSLSGKVAIVTGASRGIGARGFAPAFAKAGVKGLVLLARNGEQLEAVAAQIQEINPGVDVMWLSVNIADAKEVETAFGKIREKFGHANILVNNAGINVGKDTGPMATQDPETWWSNFEVNGKGAFLATRSFIRLLPSPDITATLINVTSAGAWSVLPSQSGYCISKLLTLQQIPFVAEEYANITAIALHPGMIDTDMLELAFRRFDLETPELVGGLSVWLSHPHARFLSGRFVASQWSVDELLARKDEIMGGRQLKVTVVGPFGRQQFE